MTTHVHDLISELLSLHPPGEAEVHIAKVVENDGQSALEDGAVDPSVGQAGRRVVKDVGDEVQSSNLARDGRAIEGE